jgi:ABC-type polar amino acid transport system ATPase subunit
MTQPERWMAEAIGIHKSFGANHVLRGVDLRMRRSEVVVIIAPSGSGKSTFLLVVQDQGFVRRQKISSGPVITRCDGAELLGPQKKFSVK